MSNIPVLSKQMLVEEVVSNNRNNDIRNSIFLRGNGEFFKSDTEKTLAAHLKSIGMESDINKFAIHHFNDYQTNNQTHKGYVLALKDPTSPDANDLMDKYIAGRKHYVDNKVISSLSYRAQTIDGVHQHNPNAFIGLPGKEFFSDPLTIAKISRNDLLKDKIESHPVTNEIRSYDYLNDGTDSFSESRVAVYALAPKPDSGLTHEAMISTIQSIYDTVEQKNEAAKDFDSTVQSQAFTDEGLQGLTPEDMSYFNRADDADIDIGQNSGKSFAEETNFNPNDYGDPSGNKGVAPNASSLNAEGNDPKAGQNGAKGNPQIKQNLPKFKDPQLDNLIHSLVDKEKGRGEKDFDQGDDRKSGKNPKQSGVSNENSAQIAQVLADIVAKLLALIMLVLKAILAAFMAFARGQSVKTAINDVYQEFKNKPKGSGSSAEAGDKNTLENSLDNKNGLGKALTNGMGFGFNNDAPQGNAPAMGDVGNNSPPRATDLVVPNELNQDVALQVLPTDRIEQIKALDFAPEEVKALSQDVFVKKEHNVADGIADVPPEFGYTLNHGALLTVSDTVENKEGVQGAVIGSFETDGDLYYNIASKNADGDYEISSHPANELTVQGYANSEFSDKPELAKELNDTQLASLKEINPKVNYFNTPTPWDNEHKETIVSLAEKGIPIVKGLNEIDQSSIKPFDEVKAEVLDKAKDEVFIAAMHTNKTGELREKVNAHPLYGELLNINDSVSVNLPTSDQVAKGAVVGAYVNNDGDLKYQVKLEDGLITNVNAKNVAVDGYDQGGLTKGELKTLAAGMPDQAKLNNSEKINLGSRIPLAHEGTDSFANDYFVKARAKVVEDLPNLKAGSKSLDANGKEQGIGLVLSHINDNNKKEKFVTVGRFMKEINGVERDVYMAMPAMTNPLTFNTARNKHFLKDEPQFFAVDDPNVKIEANGITSKHLKELVGKVSTFLHENISKGKDDFIQTNAVKEFNTQDSLMEQMSIESLQDRQELNLKSAMAYQKLYDLDPNLEQNVTADADLTAEQTNANNQQFNDAVQGASPLQITQDQELDSDKPKLGATEYPNTIEKTGTLYQGVDHADLTLVRVQDGIDELQANGQNLILNHKMENPESVRNTMHFALNAYVTDHAYGKFNESPFAFVSNLTQAAQENSISGLSASDTWFHAKDNKIVLPNATLIAPESAVIPDNVDNGSIKIVRYAEGNTPDETFQNRNTAIEQELSDRKVPIHSVNMHNWNGSSPSLPDHTTLSAALGSEQPLPTNHSNSLDGKIEGAFAYLGSLQDRKLDGEKEIQNVNTMEWKSIDSELESANNAVKNLIDKANPNAQEFLLSQYNSLTEKHTLLMNNSNEAIQDFSNMSIPDNSQFIANEADDMQDPFIQTQASSNDLNHSMPNTPAFEDIPLSAYANDASNQNIVDDSSYDFQGLSTEPTVQNFDDLANDQSVSQAPSAPPVPPPMEFTKLNALGFADNSSLPQELAPTGYSDLDQRIDDLRAMVSGEPNDTPLVYVVNETREEIYELQHAVLQSGKALYESDAIKNEVAKVKELSSMIADSQITFADGETQTSYPNITQLKTLESIGSISPELKDSVNALLDKISNDPELKRLALEYKDNAGMVQNYASVYTNEISKFVQTTTQHEAFQSGYVNDDHKEYVSKAIADLGNEGKSVLDSINSSHSNAYFVHAVANRDASKGAETLVEVRQSANYTNELKSQFTNNLAVANDHFKDPKATASKSNTNEHSLG